MRTAPYPVLIAIALLLAGCAADKKVPPPPQSSVLDVSQPVDLGTDRELLDGLPKEGYAKKVDAFGSAQGCSSVADFYTKYMRDASWTETSSSQPSSDTHSSAWNPAGLTEFTQSWKYQSRHVYIVGSVPKGSVQKPGSGCVVMTAIYTKAHRNRYESE